MTYIAASWILLGIAQVFIILVYERTMCWKDVAEMIIAIATGPFLFPIRFLLSSYSNHRQRKMLEFYNNQSDSKFR
ncbi:hypothetical protein WG31_09470 [Acetobacter oryzifermentans]|uniref:Uncharacterized protein n=1 Tax=Acetobacter oryzifermentans TaxID=1633874 RepID=A0ABM6AKW8_9PROT|nr:hypothetical protein WG31_09470 [Acetobacter oryzifermentans]